MIEEAAAGDVREGGRWSPRQRVKNDVLYASAALALAVVQLLPLATLRVLGRAIGRAAHRALGRQRRLAIDNVARAFPELPAAARAALVRRSFVTLGEALGDGVALLRARGGPLLAIEPGSRRVLEAAVAEGNGVVFASAHLGPWERVAASLVAAGLPFTTIARESYDPRFTRLYERLRGRRGVQVIWRAGAGAGARILRTLRAGGVLGMPMDLRSRVPSCSAPFLGFHASTPVGPARIALRAGAAVVVGTVAPAVPSVGAGTSHIPGSLMITATRIPTGGLDGLEGAAAAEALTARINDELSSRIRALPHAWVWMHPRWDPSRTPAL